MRSILYICTIAIFLAGCRKTEIQKVVLTELNGEKIDLSDFKGKTVFINYWATWCGPCIKEMPSIELAQNSLRDKDIVFLLASNEDVQEIEAFSKKRPYKFHYVRLMNMEELKMPALPTTHIYDADGNLAFSETGSRDWNEPNNLKLILNH
jgi:thiol-disulfide isomerase/thioredoxin